MRSGLKDKVIFVTGASGGIGREIVRSLAEEEALLAVQGHTRFEELERFVEEIGAADRSLCLRFDVGDRKATQAAMTQAAERFGRVDSCVANAGHWPTEDRPFHEIGEERMRSTLDDNLMGAIWTAQAFLQQLERQGPNPDGHGASLVFTGSTAARFGERDHADYSLAKAGLIGLMQTLKNEITRLDPYARVNVVQPGWTVTHMVRPALSDDDVVTRVVQTHALRQLARAKDIATTVAFLCSPLLSRHVSGEALTVSGGMEGRLLWRSEEVDPGAVRQRLEEDAS